MIPALYVLGSFALVWNTLMERPTESISLNFTKIEFKMTPHDDKNKAGTPITVSYDLATAKSG